MLVGLMALPAPICWGIAYGIARAEEAAFQGGAQASGVVAEVLEDRVRFNGRDSEEITEVRVTFTPAGAVAPITASAAVWSASDLQPGTPVTLQYLPAEPTKVRLQAGFFSRSSGVVFLTLFGAFWLLLDLALAVLLLRVSRRLVAAGAAGSWSAPAR